jgi:uncharacterized protein (DUF58 family)
MPESPPTRFIKPDVLSKISNLELLARSVVEGFISGLHKSPYKGFSVEFMEYRPYIPGDNLMHVDWKLYARTDRFYVKQFEEETNTTLNILVDVSQSMSYGSNGVRKVDYGFYLAATLAYFMIRQQDAVGITFFDDDIIQKIPPGSSKAHLHTLLTHLDRAELGAKSEFGKPLHALAEYQKQRSLVVLVSDLLDEPENLIEGLKHFRFNGHEVIIFHVMDPRELSFDFDDLAQFEDLETGEQMLIVPEAMREAYLENLDRFRSNLKKKCGHLGIDYTLLPSDRPLDFALFEYLAARQRRT